MSRSVNDRLLDLGIRHAIYWLRYRAFLTANVYGAFQSLLFPSLADRIERALNEIEAATGTTLSAVTTERLLRLQAEVQQLMGQAFAGVVRNTTGQLVEAAQHEVAWQVNTIEKAADRFVLDLATPAPGIVEAALRAPIVNAKPLAEWITGIERQARESVINAVRVGVIEGRTAREITAGIVQTDTAGPLEITRRQIEAVVRTAATETAAFARQRVYEANSDLVGSWMFVATLDSRTTLVCMEHDGKTYPVGENRWKPPLHFQCRSTDVPVLVSAESLGLRPAKPGTRASMNGQVPEKTTYEEWLRRQSKELQIEALGPARAALFRNGTPIGQFIDAQGKQLSLAELRAVELS